MSSPEQHTKKKLPGTDVAVDSKHVFVDLGATTLALEAIIDDEEKGRFTFVRAPVAAGKSTLCKYLCRTFPDKYVEIETGISEANFFQRLVEVCRKNLNLEVETPQGALIAFAGAGKVLVLDEAHEVFSYQKAFALLATKIVSGDDVLNLKILMFSAGSTGKRADGTIVFTPSEIRKKLMWYPPIPVPQALLPQLEEADVRLDEASLNFFLKLCNFHRGIFMMAMDWVKEQQGVQSNKATGSSPVSWDIDSSVKHVRASFATSASNERKKRGTGWDVGLRKSMKQSRAVKVNGDYSVANSIPDVFLDVLFGGPQGRENLNNRESDLTLAGLIVPERTGESIQQEFVPYDWNKEHQDFGVANTLMAQYYRDIFHAKGYEAELSDDSVPTSGADLLARILPYMSFSAVVDPPTRGPGEEINTPLSAAHLPYEDHYNRALWRWLTELDYTASQPGTSGKADVVVSFDEYQTTFSIETIMGHRDIKEHNRHANRFAKKTQPNYSGQDFKTLLSIGSDREELLEKARTVKRGVDVEVVACLVSQAHDSYEIYVLKPGSGECSGPVFIYCDMVSRALSDTDSTIKSIQRKRKRE